MVKLNIVWVKYLVFGSANNYQFNGMLINMVGFGCKWECLGWGSASFTNEFTFNGIYFSLFRGHLQFGNGNSHIINLKLACLYSSEKYYVLHSIFCLLFLTD